MVELKKELPEIFEEFAEQRKNSFLAIKEVKEKEIPVVGVFCTYLPREIPNAMGAAVVGLCSVSDETIPDAEKDLPRNLCPLSNQVMDLPKQITGFHLLSDSLEVLRHELV